MKIKKHSYFIKTYLLINIKMLRKYLLIFLI